MDTSESSTTIDTNPPHSNRSIQFYRSSAFVAHLAKWAKHYRIAQEQNPFTPATLIVHSHAMAMYLKNKLAKKLGIATRIRFLLPVTFDREVRKTLLHPPHIETKTTEEFEKHSDHTSLTLTLLRGNSIFDPKYLEWIILSIISNKENHDAICNLPVLGNYLFSSNKGGKKKNPKTFLPLRAVEFSGQMARVFNRYLFFREFQLRDWEIGHMEPSSEHVWQQWLWQQITTTTAPATYRENELETIKTKLQENSVENSLLLQNQFGYTSIFAVSYLPPYYVNLLNTLSSALPLDFFYFDSTQPVFTATTLKEEQAIYYPAFFEELSTMSNAFVELIERQNWRTTYLDKLSNPHRGIAVSNEANFDYGFQLTLLPFIQSFFNELPNLENIPKVSPSEMSKETSKALPLPHNLHSVFSDLQIHSCPNPLVEVEVTKNQILRLMESNPELSVDNILILAPDIEAYRSYLEVVMNRTPRIPFGIIDYKENSQNQILNAVFYVLELFQSDFRVSKLIPLLEKECVKIRGGWGNVELNQFTELVQALGIRWGRGNPDNRWLEKYSWKTGIEKIMTSYAGAINLAAQPIQNGEPGFTLNGEEAKSIGKIIYWLQNLFDFYAQTTPTCLQNWLVRLEEMVTLLLFETRKGYQYSRELNRDHARFQELIKNLHRELTLTSTENLGKNQNFNFSKDFAIDLIVFTNLLRNHLADHDFLARNPTGVMCGSLLPLRTIPAEATFLLGMNRENFPRHDEENQFDLILQKPQPLDRTKKKDDQLLFFETIFSTRSYLSISYSPSTGFEYSENTSPSTLVDGLLQEISSRLSSPEYHSLVDGIQHEHPPHTFLAAPERFHAGNTLREYSPLIYSQAKMLHSLNQDHNRAVKEKSNLREWNSLWKDLNDYLAGSAATTSNGYVVEGINYLSRKATLDVSKSKSAQTSEKAALSIRVQDLIAWIINPVEQYCKRVLKINLDISEEQLANAEPLELDPLSEYQMLTPVIKKHLHELFLNDKNTISKNFTHSHHTHFSPELAETHPQFPAGNLGKSKLYQLELSLAQIEHQLAGIQEELSSGKMIQSMEEFELYKEYGLDTIFSSQMPSGEELPEKIHVHGWVEALQLGEEASRSNDIRITRIYVRYKKIKSKDLIRAWIEHILLSVSPSVPAGTLTTWVVGKDEIKLFSSITPQVAETELKKLLKLYILAHAIPIPIHEELVDKFLTETNKKRTATVKNNNQETSTTSEHPLNLISELVPEEDSFNPKYGSYLNYVRKIWSHSIKTSDEGDLQQADKTLSLLSQSIWGSMGKHLGNYPPINKTTANTNE